MKRVAPRADVNHGDTAFLQLCQRCSADRGTNSPATRVRVDGNHPESAGAVGVYLPTHVAQWPLAVLGKEDKAVGVWIMESRDFLAIFLLPVSVVVSKHTRVEHFGQVRLEKGPEGFDSQVDQGGQVRLPALAKQHVFGFQACVQDRLATSTTLRQRPLACKACPARVSVSANVRDVQAGVGPVRGRSQASGIVDVSSGCQPQRR